MRFARLVNIHHGVPDTRSHWFDHNYNHEEKWYSLCKETADQIMLPSQILVPFEYRTAYTFYNLRRFPRLCRKCQRIKTMLELAE